MTKPTANATKLWDLTTRALHWALAGSVLLCFLTVWVFPPAAMIAHYWLGGVAGAALVVRLIWGFTGSQYSRFNAFPIGPRSLIAHFRSVLARDKRHWPGHPPLAAAVMLVMLLALAAMVVTGLVQLGGHEAMGPLRGLVSFSGSGSAHSLHAAISNGVVFLIGLHFLGLIVESLLFRENLAKSMISGERKIPTVVRVMGRPAIGLPLAGLVLAVGGYGLFSLSQMPARGTHPMVVNADFVRECSACHWAFHPSLMPAASWHGLMGHLDHHFGEDASLSPKLVESIEGFLVANASETWDTLPATVFRRVNADKPYELTAFPYWVRRHREISDATFKSKAVGAKTNCVACHQDATEGKFHLTAIHIPGD